MRMPRALACIVELVDHWQTLIAGGFALVAGIAAYRIGLHQARATTQASKEQLAAAARKDRMQARCLAVGISPELLQLQAALGRARDGVGQFGVLSGRNTAEIITGLRNTKIGMPPILEKITDQVYMLGEPAGPTVLQLIAVIYQFDHLIDTVCDRVRENPDYFNAAQLQHQLTGQLTMIDQLIPMAQGELEQLHAEATAGVH
jgi:hypothetical protein